MPNRTGPASAPDAFRRTRRPRPRQDGGDFTPPEGEHLVLVQFKGHRKGCYHNRQAVPVSVGDYCVVEADRGRDLGRVIYVGPGRPHWWRQAVDQGVVGLARPEELARLHENRGDEWRFFDVCVEKIQERSLPMDLVTVERQYDHNKITFYFTAEKRVDFRELVKDLAGIFRTRIELRQIGVRDEARLKGGLGVCGRALCCSTFLDEFVPVTLKMAKDQQLPLSPNKLSGLCGRLRCCITYEHAGYHAAARSLPRVGATVRARGQEGSVRKLDLVRELVTVFFAEPGETAVLAPAQLEWDREQDLPASRPRTPRRSGRRRH